MLKDWTKFEKYFLILGTFVAGLCNVLFNGTFVDLGYALLYFWTALL